MIYVYSENISNRLEYICEIIFNSILNCSFTIISSEKETHKLKEPIINYSNNKKIKGIQIIPHELLQQKSITSVIPKTFDWDGDKAFFKTSESNLVPFDIFSAAFYLVSRYEEYKLKKRDKHNRFVAEYSFAYKEDIYSKPIVDLWAFKLKSIILNKFPEYKFKDRKFTYIPTIDIDNAWAYKYKGFVRTVMGTARTALKFHWADILRRIGVLLFNMKDPYENYELIEQLHTAYQLKPIYFFLLRNNGKYDTSHDPSNKTFIKLIKDISKKVKIGIHPSYTSNSSKIIIKAETSLLSSITNQKIKKSRSHFLRIRIPKTYVSLEKIGIEEDYSLGYSSILGFRAGTCTPYYFFNLKKNKKTGLLLFPFQVMDATLKYYLNLNPQQAITEVQKIIEEIKKVNGTFISIWHNESFSNKGIWKGWLPVYQKMLEFCKN